MDVVNADFVRNKNLPSASINPTQLQCFELASEPHKEILLQVLRLSLIFCPDKLIV